MGWYGTVMDSGTKPILAVTFEKEFLLKMVLILPCTRGEWCYKKNRMRVSVGYDLPDIKNGEIDEEKFVICGSHPYQESDYNHGDMYAISCGKCLAMGTVVVLDNLLEEAPELEEVAFFGLPKNEIL